MSGAMSEPTTPALPSHIADERQFLAAVEEGKQALREGQLIDHDAVTAAFNRIIRPLPRDHE